MNFIGYGYDIHRLVEGRALILGGVKIPFAKGLLGHSDGDVLVHALIDALLGGCSLGDIGESFPDNDLRYEDISSLILLEKTCKLIERKSFKIGNIDITVVLEQPKISKLKVGIRKNLAEVLRIDPVFINIKAKTGDGLDATGRGEAVSAYAVVNILKESS